MYTTVFGRHVDYMLLQYTIYSARPVAAQQQARRALCSAAVSYFLTISIKPIISKFTGPVFVKFSGLIELRCR